jgi:hypothetical protein
MPRLPTGSTGKDGRLLVKMSSLRQVAGVEMRDGSELKPRVGGKIFVAEVQISNNGTESIDLYCKWHFEAGLIDAQGRKFDAIKGYTVKGNTGCNQYLQPGFSASERIVFEVPENAIPAYAMFWDPKAMERSSSDPWQGMRAIRFQVR